MVKGNPVNSGLRNALFVVLGTLIVAASGECLLRVAGSVVEDVMHKRREGAESWVAYSPSLGWERRPGFRGDVAGVRREFDAAGYVSIDSPQVASTGNWHRVLFLGDSNTFGIGLAAEESYVEQVEHLVPGIAAINLAVIGYSSYQGNVALRRYLPVLKPDLVVASFNLNDRRYVTPPGTADGPAAFERAYAAARGPTASVARVLEFVHVYRGVRGVLQLAGLVRRRDTQIDVGSLTPRVDEESYRRNLAQIAEQARRFGIPLIFVVLKDNPFESDHLNRGIAALERNDREAALAYLTSAVTSHRMFSDLARVYLAKAKAARGDDAGARAVLSKGELYRSFSGGTLIRRDAPYNEIMRQVARQYGAAIVEAGEELDKHPSVYVDFCHFDAEGHRLVAALIAPLVSRHLRLPLARSGG